MRKCGKMNWPKVFSFFLLAVFLSLPLYHCGGRIRTFPSQGEVDGTWNLVLIKDGVTVRSPQLSLTQKERYGDFSGTSSDGAMITGGFNVNTVTITLNNADGSVTTLNNGEFSDNGRTISGTYSSTGSDGPGTWTATRPFTPPSLAVTPQSASLSCSLGQSQTFTVTGGNRANYSVVATQNGTLVTLSATTLTTNGQFTVTANTTCTEANGTVVNLTVSDTVTSIPVTVTISNP
jgi:hypothetical protein